MVLPGLSFEGGIPSVCRTVIAVPVMISSVEGIVEMIDRIEDHYLANDDRNCSMPWSATGRMRVRRGARTTTGCWRQRRPLCGSSTRGMVTPASCCCIAAVAGMRSKGLDGVGAQAGKLHELNLLLRGSTDTSFVQMPDPVPSGIRYVIVLDADTMMPRGAARRLIGKMAHPQSRLNSMRRQAGWSAATASCSRA